MELTVYGRFFTLDPNMAFTVNQYVTKLIGIYYVFRCNLNSGKNRLELTEKHVFLNYSIQRGWSIEASILSQRYKTFNKII